MKTIGGCALAACVATFNLCVAQEPKRQCRPAEWPKRLPALDAVVDSAALFDLIDTSSAADTTTIVLSILYKDDATAAIRVLEPAGTPSPEVTFFLQNLSRGLRRLPPPSPLGALRVRLRAGPARVGTVDRSVYCRPEVAPGLAPGSERMRVEFLPGDRPPPSGGRLHLDVQVSIDETGLVTDVRLHSSSGLRELDERIVNDEHRIRYLPATIDGLPVPSWMRSNGATMRL